MSLATCLTVWSGLVFGQTAAAPVPLPQTEPASGPAIVLPSDATPRQLEHIAAAARELREASLTGLATQLEDALQTARQAEVRQALADRQAQLQVLQREIAALERQLVARVPILFEFKIVRVDREKLRQQDPAIFQELARRMAAQQGPVPQVDPVTPPMPTRELLARLCAGTETGTVSILSAPRLITRDGQEANLHMGGEYPMLVGLDPNPVYRNEKIGTIIAVHPRVSSPHAVHCSATVEQSELNFENARVISAGGPKIPGKDIVHIATQFEAKFGETVLLPCLESQPMQTLVFVSVDRAEGLPAPVAAGNLDASRIQPVLHTDAVDDVLPAPLTKARSLSAESPWISPITLLMRTLLETDTTLHDAAGELKADVQYFPAPPPSRPAPTVQP